MTPGYLFHTRQRRTYRPGFGILLAGAGLWGVVAASILFACAAKPVIRPILPDSLIQVHPLITATVAVGDSLKVKMEWTQPADDGGNADSTLYRLKLSKPWRFYSDTVLRPAGTFVRRKRTTQTSDSLKLSLAIGDSVSYAADSIRQCRKGVCSVPGSAAFLYHRNVAPPPAMTFLKVTTDSF